MNVNQFIFAVNPFFDAYSQADWLGKLIFIGLIALSICSWVIILHKGWITYLARSNSLLFYKNFETQRMNPLGIEPHATQQHPTRSLNPNPFSDLYGVLKKYSLEILTKNRRFGQRSGTVDEGGVSYMSPTDIDYVQSHLMATVAHQTKYLEKNLFILSTIVSLAPFLGLLGTVWGILMTFSDLQSHGGGGGENNAVLAGISLALATTVLGLIDAIPALIGYNYLKNSTRDFQIDMEGFSNELLASVELYYRKVDVS